MRSIFTVVYLLVLLISVSPQAAKAGGLGSDKLLWEANQLYREFKDTEALEKFELVLALDPAQQEALCKASILCGRIGNRYGDDTYKGIYFQKSLGYAQRALAVDSTHAEANFVTALSLSLLSQTSSLKQRMQHLVLIKRYLQSALTYDAMHSGAWHLLGRWNYKVANMSFAERAASKLFTQQDLLTVTNQEAITAIYKSIELEPSNLLYYYDLARVLHDADQTNECISILQKALDQKLVTSEDLELSRRCRLLLQEVMKVRA
ncbi:hypothetical protein [Rufibacter sp. LB8]|uniref:hypothetical protein n=1 Tax=Rufibacter sp. LB8 TaxID=2777781 RepID=UPI00178C5B93|nr:hypothetical protein [Rufibacter sp. LB8]